MIYVMSDLHGRFDKYKMMLTKLNLKDTDALFVLGDVIDKGDDGIKILKDMMYRANIYPILGEHEYMAKKILPEISNAQSVDDCVNLVSDENKLLFASWVKSGGLATIEKFLALSDEDRESIIDYLDEFEPYEEIEAASRDFVLVHAGIKDFDASKELDEYDESDFVLEKADYSTAYFKNKFLITGHTVTEDIPGAKEQKVFSAKKHLAINCSEDGNGKLAAVCLDTMKVYYV